MFFETIILLPCCMGILWSLVYLTRRKKTMSQIILFYIAACNAIDYYGAAIYYSGPSSRSAYEIAGVLFIFAGLALIPLIILYTRSVRTSETLNMKWGLMVTPSVLITVIAAVLFILGRENEGTDLTQTVYNSDFMKFDDKNTIQKLELINNVYAYYTILLAQLIWAGWYFAKTYKEDNLNWKRIKAFLQGGVLPMKSIVLILNIIACVICLVGEIMFSIVIRTDLYILPICTFPVLVFWTFLYFYMGLLTTVEYGTLDAIFRPVAFSQQEMTQMGNLVRESEMGKLPYDSNYTKTLHNFKSQMDDDMIYLNKEITIEDLARYIGSNRTYVSLIVNREFNMTFRDYINKKRVEFAKKYLMENPNDTQEMVADRCGFASASAFNRKFTQEVGVSPRTWREIQKAKR